MSKKPFLSKNSIIILVITTLLAGLSAIHLTINSTKRKKTEHTKDTMP